jgi:hypothetical protein
VLALCVLVLGAQRLHTYDEPLERDLTTYAVIGHEALGGRWLYSELWDNKSPLVYATYAGSELIAGYGSPAMFLLGFSAAVITLLGIYAAVRAATTPTAGLWAAAAWTLVSADLKLQANQPNIEVFLNATTVWLFALVVARTTRPLVIGVLGALASLYKLVVVPLLFALHLAYVAVAPAAERRAAGIRAVVSLLTAAAAWGAVLAYFGVTGRSTDFWQAVFAYNQSFAGSMLANIGRGLTPATLLPLVLRVLPLVALTLVGLIWLARARQMVIATAWLAYAFGTAVAVALPGKFYPHYYQLWLPVYCVGAGIGMHALAQWLGAARTRWWPSAIGAVAIGAVLAIELPSYGLSAESWSAAKYGPTFVDVKRLAPDVATLLIDDETFFEWGDEAGFYYYGHRRPSSRFLYLYPAIVASPLRPQLEAQLLADLRRSEPEVLIVNTTYLYPGMESLPIAQWMGTRYYRWDRGPRRGAFEVYILAGGALEARLRRAGRI